MRFQSLFAMTATVVFLVGVVTPAVPQGEEQSLFEQWDDVLAYGIDSEVVDLVEQIEEHGTDRFDGQIAARFSMTRSQQLRIAIIQYFTRAESDRIAEPVQTLFLADEPLADDLLRACVGYLADIVHDDSTEVLDRYAEMAEGTSVLAATVAIGAIGRSDADGAYETLIELYRDVESEDARSSVLRALGTTGAVEAVPFLTGIAEDEYELSLYRQSAALSLGEIAAPESLSTLLGLLSSDDSILRAYAVQALGFYHNDEAAAALTDALRDSFWRVRVAALQGLAEQGGAAALPAVAYKAQHDPETPVRQAAITTLGSLGGNEATTVLREVSADVRTSEALRIHALNVLADTALDESVDHLLELASEEWGNEDSRILDTIGRIASGNESPALAPLLAHLFQHPNYIIRIYAMRGFGRNGLTEYTEDLVSIADDSPAGIIRTTALAALEQLGVEYIPPDERDVEEGETDDLLETEP